MQLKTDKHNIKYNYMSLLNQIPELVGGNLKIFDLDNIDQFNGLFVKNKLESNLNKLVNKLGKLFTVKYMIDKKQLLIDVKLNKITTLDNNTFYSLVYTVPNRTTPLANIRLDFIDPVTQTKNNNSYISQIQKTDQISGSQLIKLCLKINEVLKVKKTFIKDDAKIKCNGEEIDLSFIKLLEKNKTYYMNFGFDFELTNTEFFYYRFPNNKKLRTGIINLCKKIRKIKTIDIINEYIKTKSLMDRIIVENEKNKFQIELELPIPIFSNTYYKENPKKSIDDIIIECNKVLEILNNAKNKKYFYEVLIKLFNTNCVQYQILFNYIIKNRRKQLIYKDICIKRPYMNDFNLLLTYKTMYYYSLTFYK